MIRILMYAVCVLFAACSGGPTTIGGRVVDHRGTPVPRAELSTEPETDVVVSNSRGFFVLRQRINDLGETEPIAPGVYLIRVRKFGFQELAVEVTAEGGPLRIQDLVMQPRTPDIGEAAPEATEERQTEADEGSTPKIGI